MKAKRRGYSMIDLLSRLKDNIRGLDLNYILLQNVTDEDDSLVITALPGGRTIRTYYDNVKDKELNYELRGRTKQPEKVEQELTLIAEHLEDLQALPSGNGSYEFIDITVSDEPYFIDADDAGFFEFSLGFSVKVTIF